MAQYLEFLPSELIEEIFYYIEEYNDIINLLNFDTFKKVITGKLFKRLFKEKFGDLTQIINLDFNVNLRYIISSYIRSIKIYVSVRDKLNYFTDKTNEYIRRLYPNLSIGKVNEQKLIEDGNFNALYSKLFTYNLKGDNYVKFSTSIINKLDNLTYVPYKKKYELFLTDYSSASKYRLRLMIGYPGYVIGISHFSNPGVYDFYLHISRDEMFYVLFSYIFNTDISNLSNIS